MQDETINTLNEPQKEAALTLDSHVRIIAGAGSGKTRVLMARIANLIDNGILPWKILAITFTNKAAREMKERLESLVGDVAKDVRISTIHSLCVRILREDGDILGYPKSFAIADAADQKQILRPHYKEMQLDKNFLSPASVLSYISNWKTNKITPAQAQEQAHDDKSQAAASLYEKYQHDLEDMRVMDFDDLLLKAEQLLATSEDVRTKWQNRLDYIHVDEFQDVDEIQYHIIRLLTGPDSYLCVVGDPDQTIYTWRGASVSIILNFAKDFPGTRTIILNENYRSTQPILDAANALIANNKNRVPKNLFTKQPGDKRIETFEGTEEAAEPLQVARDINNARKNGMDWKDIAILYRSNYLSRSFERVLGKLGIPYNIYGGIRFYERQEVKDLLSYLRLAARPDPADPQQKSLDLAVLRVLNVPRRGIGARTIEKLEQEGRQRNLNLMEVLRDPQTITPATAKKFTPFVELIDEMKEAAKTLPMDELLLRIAYESGYMQMLKDTNEDERMDNIMELKNDMAQTLKEEPETTLESYLQDISLFTDRQQENPDAVSLMTVHAAKGLEFDQVHVIGLNEGVFPSQRALDESGASALEEERRLLYVAMTRARKQLFLSWNRDYSYVIDGYKLPSRFIKEIPSQYIKKEKSPLEHAAIHKKPKAGTKAAPRQKLRKGDLVEHTVFGQGVIISIQKDIASIAFGHPNGVKKLNVNHPSLQKISR